MSAGQQSDQLAAQKKALRLIAARSRDKLGSPARAVAGLVAADHLMAWLAASRGGAESAAPPGPFAVFRSLPREIDTAPAIERLWVAGWSVLLPRQAGRGLPLAFHLWHPGQPLVSGPFGVEEPAPTAPVLQPFVLLVPLLAFDRRGHRLGYGAGFYDRTLARLRRDGQRPLAIGYAFAAQEVTEVPTGPSDEPLDLVITEAGPFRPEPWVSPGPPAPKI